MPIELYTSDIDILATLKTLFSLFVACKIIEITCLTYRKAIYVQRLEDQKLWKKIETVSTQTPKMMIKMSVSKDNKNDVIFLQNCSQLCQTVDQKQSHQLETDKSSQVSQNQNKYQDIDNDFSRSQTLPIKSCRANKNLQFNQRQISIKTII